MKKQATFTTVVLLTLSVGWLAAAHTVAETGTITVYSDVEGSHLLLEGHYAEALKEMKLSKGENPIFLQNNLCAAYILSKGFAEAKQACRVALAATERSTNYGDWLERTQANGIRKMYRQRAIAHLKTLHLMQAKRLADGSDIN